MLAAEVVDRKAGLLAAVVLAVAQTAQITTRLVVPGLRTLAAAAAVVVFLVLRVVLVAQAAQAS